MRILNNNLIRSVVPTTILFSALAGAYVTENAKVAADKLGADEVIELGFDAGKSELNQRSRRDLDLLVENAAKKGRIDQVRVAVWGDREYPSGVEKKAAKKQSELAKTRAESVRRYLQNQLKVEKVESFNMTERPNFFATSFHTDDSQVKKTLESAGAAPNLKDEKGPFDIRAQASTALIFLKMIK